MFTIGIFSKLVRVSIRMLRYYDETGLFKPEKVDGFTGYRYYSAKQIEKLNTIVLLRDLDFNVSEISQYINCSNKEEKQKYVNKEKTEITNAIESKKIKIEAITSTIKNMYKEKVKMSYSVNIKEVPSYKVIALRDKIPAYNQEGLLWERLGNHMKKEKIVSTGYCYATYYDEDCRESNVDVEVVMEVMELGENNKDITYRKTQALNKVASVLVPGPFTNIAKAFDFIANWIEENNKEITGNPRQLPIKGPWNEKNPDNYLTEIQFPIK